MNELPTDPGQELSTFTDLFVSVLWKPIEPKETAQKKQKKNPAAMIVQSSSSIIFIHVSYII
jgi:hypothetical protein